MYDLRNVLSCHDTGYTVMYHSGNQAQARVKQSRRLYSEANGQKPDNQRYTNPDSKQ